MKKTTKELMEECGMDASKLYLYESQEGEVVPLQYNGTLEDFRKEYKTMSWEDYDRMIMGKMGGK